MPDPIDYISPLGRFADAGQLMQAMQLGDAQIATAKAQGQAFQAQAAQRASEAQRLTSYQQAVERVLRDPTNKDGYRRLLLQFPEFAEPIKAAHNSLDEDQKRLDLSQATDVAALALAGNYKGAADSLRRRVDADKAAGHADEQDEALLAELESGDLTRQKAAAGLAAAHVAAIGGIEHFSGIMDSLKVKPDDGFTLSQGQTRYDANGNPIASVAPKEDFLVIPEGGSAIPISQIGSGYVQPKGGDPASGGAGVSGGAPAGRTQYGWTPRERNGGDNSDAAVDGKLKGMAQFLGRDIDAPITDLSPMKIAQALTLSEGGPGSLADRNNNPGNLTDGKGGYRKFPTKQAGLNAAAAQVARNLKRGQTTIRTMVEGLPVGGQASAAPSGPTTGPGGVIYGRPKQTTRVMSPAEVAAVPGLDPNTAYQISPEGTITPIGGQRSQLKPWPVAALAKVQVNRAALKTLEPLYRLLDPKNSTKEAQTARNAIGTGTGALGDTFTQWNNPEGTQFRSQLGKIASITIKDTSGANVTVGEEPRLRQWIPYTSDRPEVARDKLFNLIQALRNDTVALTETYNEDQGYRTIDHGKTTQPAQSGWGKARRVN